jgi:hypothetical protein
MRIPLRAAYELLLVLSAQCSTQQEHEHVLFLRDPQHRARLPQ